MFDVATDRDLLTHRAQSGVTKQDHVSGLLCLLLHAAPHGVWGERPAFLLLCFSQSFESFW